MPTLTMQMGLYKTDRRSRGAIDRAVASYETSNLEQRNITLTSQTVSGKCSSVVYLRTSGRVALTLSNTEGGQGLTLEVNRGVTIIPAGLFYTINNYPETSSVNLCLIHD